MAAENLSGAAQESNGAVCCLPAAPCGELLCKPLQTPEACVALAGTLALVNPDASECGQESIALPEWQDMIVTFVYLPGAAFLLVVVLWVVFAQLYSAAKQRSPWFNKMVLNTTGSLENPYPRSNGFLVAVNCGQIASSLLTMAIVVLNTYQRRVLPLVVWVEVALGIFLAFAFFVHGFRHEFKVSSIFRLGPLIDMLTVPGMLLLPFGGRAAEVHWVSPNFLRSFQAEAAYEFLDRLGALSLAGGEVAHEISLLVLRFVTLVTTFASLVFMCEILGDLPLGPDELLIDTAMGNISFFTMIYWIIETVSTVGYGDFTPKTLLSRLVTVVCMVSGVAFFTYELEKILSIIARQQKGAGSYTPTWRSHVVLFGGGVQHADETLLLAFLEELFHRSYRNYWPELVVMCSEIDSMEKMREMIELQLPLQVRKMIHFLVGSPLNFHDLNRCCCGSADLVFIIADTTGNIDTYDEDKENILRALSLKNSFPDTQLRLMLLMQESKERALSVGIHNQRCFSVNEMKSSLFWQSCRCRGWNTLLCNLMVTTDVDEVSEKDLKHSPWLSEYVVGMGHEIYGFLPRERFIGKSFQSVTCEAYKETGILVFAAQIEGHIVVAPLAQLRTVGRETVLFALAQDDAGLHGIAADSKSVDWRQVFLNCRLAMFSRMDNAEGGGQNGQINEDGYAPLAAVLEGETHAFREASGGSKVPASSTLGSSIDIFDDLRPGEAEPYYLCFLRERQHQEEESISTGPSAADEAAAGAPNNVSFKVSVAEDVEQTRASKKENSSAGMQNKMMLRRQQTAIGFRAADSEVVSSQLIQDLERRAKEIKQNADEAPFVLLLDHSQSWQSIMSFIQHSRVKYMPFDMPLVVLCSITPSEGVAERLELQQDSALGVVIGSPSWQHDLLRSGVKECSIIVCLGQDGTSESHFTGELVAMLDADIVMLQRMLKRMLHEPNVRNKAMIFEFKRAQNMRLLPKPSDDFASRPLSRQSRRSSDRAGGSTMGDGTESGSFFGWNRKQTSQADDCSGPGVLQLDPRFASGEVFTPQPLGALLAHAFYTPGIVEVMQAFIAVDEEDVSAMIPWQVHLQPQQVGKRYGDVLESLIKDETHPVIPLGLLRHWIVASEGGAGTSSDKQQMWKQYVWTNPDANARLRQSDWLFVLGDRDFGQAAYEAGLLPMSGPQSSSISASESRRKPASTRRFSSQVNGGSSARPSGTRTSFPRRSSIRADEAKAGRSATTSRRVSVEDERGASSPVRWRDEVEVEVEEVTKSSNPLGRQPELRGASPRRPAGHVGRVVLG